MNKFNPFFLERKYLWPFLVEMKSCGIFSPFDKGSIQNIYDGDILSRYDLIIMSQQPSGIHAATAPESWYDASYNFLITEMTTKGGVILKKPEDILWFLEKQAS